MSMEANDEQLAARATQGDKEAFRQLVLAHSQRVFRVCFRITGEEMLAEDAVQETFLKAWQKRQTFVGRSRYTTWLHRIAANAAIDLLRRRRNLTLGTDEDAAAHADRISGNDPTVEAKVDASVATEVASRAMQTLTTMERAAFSLRHFEGIPIKDISRSLKIGESACKHAIFRAVKKLRAAMHDYEVKHETSG